MLMNTLWGIVSPMLGLFYAGMQVMVPCLPPAPLSMSDLNTDEYKGSWYFVSAAVWEEADLKFFQATDSSVLHIQRDINSTLKVTETIRIKDTCKKYVKTYHALYETNPFLFSADFSAVAVVWDGKYINCPSCAIILHVNENDEVNTLLFGKKNMSKRTTIQPYMYNPESDPEDQEGPMSWSARTPKITDEVMQEFKTKMECVFMEDFFTPPAKHDYCKLEDSA